MNELKFFLDVDTLF